MCRGRGRRCTSILAGRRPAAPCLSVAAFRSGSAGAVRRSPFRLPARGGRAGASDAAADEGADVLIARRGDNLGAFDNAFLASGSSRRAPVASGIADRSVPSDGFAVGVAPSSGFAAMKARGPPPAIRRPRSGRPTSDRPTSKGACRKVRPTSVNIWECQDAERSDEAIPLDRRGALRTPRDDKSRSLIHPSRSVEMHPAGAGPLNYAGLAADLSCRGPRLRLVPAVEIPPP